MAETQDFKHSQKKHQPLITPIHEQIVHRFRINPWLSWLIIGEILGGSAYLAVLLSKGTMAWIGQLAAMYAIVVMIAGAGPIWVRNELERLLPALNSAIDLPPKKIHKWYLNELRALFSTKGMVIYGIITVILTMGSFIYQTRWYTKPEIWWGTPTGDWVVTIVVSVLMFLLGMACYLIIQIARMVHQLPRLPLKMTIYQHPSASISAVGTVLQRFSIVCVITVGVVSITAVPLSPFRNEMGWLLIGWLTLTGCTVITFFIFPQYRLHVAMANAKANKIRALTKHLTRALEKAIEEPTSQRISYVGELFELYQHLLGMPEWPFNARSFISLLSAVIIPILLSIVQHFISR